MGKINAKLGTDYGLFNYYGAPDADRVVVCMGSFCDTLEEVIDYLTAQGEKVGLVKVRLFRPFSIKHFVDVLPETVKKIAVMDRTKEPAPLVSLCTRMSSLLSTRLARPASPWLAAVYGPRLQGTRLLRALSPSTRSSRRTLPLASSPSVSWTTSPACLCPRWRTLPTRLPRARSSASSGVSAATVPSVPTRNSTKIIGDHTDKYIQSYFQYDSKKTGGVTISHVRFGDHPIRSPYYITKADFVACHYPSYITKALQIAQGVKPGGTLLNQLPVGCRGARHHLSAEEKRYIAKNDVQLYTIDAIDLAAQVGMGKRTNTVLQSAFFALAKVLPSEDAIQYMKDAATKSYSKKGMDIVEANPSRHRRRCHRLQEGPRSPLTGPTPPTSPSSPTRSAASSAKQVKAIMEPIELMEGDSLPVSAFVGHEDGQFVTVRFRLREARRRRYGSALGRRQVHPVQPVLLCLPARHHPSVRPHRGRDR